MTASAVIASRRRRRGNPGWGAGRSGSPRRFAPRDDEFWAVTREKLPCVYLMASGRNGTLYAGLTSDLPKRAWQHREGLVEGFTKKHGCKMLVWFERHDTMESAILREKQIKAGSRKKKLALIEAENPTWRDLYADIAQR